MLGRKENKPEPRGRGETQPARRLRVLGLRGIGPPPGLRDVGGTLSAAGREGATAPALPVATSRLPGRSLR